MIQSQKLGFPVCVCKPPLFVPGCEMEFRQSKNGQYDIHDWLAHNCINFFYVIPGNRNDCSVYSSKIAPRHPPPPPAFSPDWITELTIESEIYSPLCTIQSHLIRFLYEQTQRNMTHTGGRTPSNAGKDISFNGEIKCSQCEVSVGKFNFVLASFGSAFASFAERQFRGRD